ncbi:hypothetical protein AB0H37_42610 [Actinomadura sp. NPDC023710]|uniref:Eco57I restriction-modification methylase domain-containing protein n=1 Tax=Actinomadura sp. NPDC023710 TaxID=3158219 RepID=UPI0033D2870F
MADAAGRAERFLEDVDAGSLSWLKPHSGPVALTAEKVLLGHGDSALEIAVAYSSGPPRAGDVRRLWRLRHGNRPSPVLLAVLYPALNGIEATVCGVTGDPAVIPRLDADRVEQICAVALAEPNRHAAARTLERLLAGIKDQLTPGLVNRGLFATHELRQGVPQRADWPQACQAATPLLGMTGLELIRALGHSSVSRGSDALLLTDEGTSRAIAVLLDESELFDRPGARFGLQSPVAHARWLAERENIRWVIVLRGSQIRIHPAEPDIGVGRKSPSETYAELDLALLSPEDAGYLQLFFSPAALQPGGTIDQILSASANFAADLGTRLRERIYRDVVPGLAVAIAGRMGATSEDELEEAYHRTLLILFRLLFLAYAEDRDLLPYGRNPRYSRHAVKTLAQEFAAEPDPRFDPAATSLWDDILTVWRAVDEGNRGWDVPAYNGGLFSHDPQRNPSGAALTGLRLTDAEFGPALRALLVDSGEDGTQGPVDFRSLSVREFGTIYEGLLESSLSLAPTALTIDAKGKYLPAGDGDTVEVSAGQVYPHNKSGLRKSTGSYFTKPFAVDHLLDHALEPALADHLDRVRALLDAGDEAAAADAFFDFRVADLSMGSGHFLVAAIDRIAIRFTSFVAEHPIPAVHDELTRLGNAARDALGDQAGNVEIEWSTLLRRQVARRCIYGLDLNLMAVELARLAVWIHTFVPGLPMSSLDHGLVRGNSLTGIGTIDEVLDVLDADTGSATISIFDEPIRDALETARSRLMRVARTAEATKQEVHAAARAYNEALSEATDAIALFNAAIAVRLGFLTNIATPDQAITKGNSTDIRTRMEEMLVAHMPARFPEVFLRDRPGFDVILGNPPWEKLQVEEHSFYAPHFPGLRSLSQARANQEMERIRRERPDLAQEYRRQTDAIQLVKTALAKGPYPGLTAGRPDLYKAFAWRMWHLTRDGGRIGVVLPRKALEASGMADWRQVVLREGTVTDLTTLTNTGRWVFDDVHPQYTIGLVALRVDRSPEPGRQLPLRGPFHDLASFHAGTVNPADELPVDALLGWSEPAAVPLLPNADALRVFLTIRGHPRLDRRGPAWHVRGLRELNATDDKHHFRFEHAPGRWPVYKGESFERWNPETGTVYAWADPAHITDVLQARRTNQVRTRRSAFYRMPTTWAADPNTLPCMAPRIAWRDVARATDSRTIVAALVPPQTILTHQAFYLFWRDGGAKQQAYVLGVISAIPFDWFARQMVESHVTVEFMRAAPMPQFDPDAALCQRVVHIAGRLAAVDHRYADWAAEAEVPVASVADLVERDSLIAELDAVVAHLYGLSQADLEHIFATFHRGWDDHDRRAAALHQYGRWAPHSVAETA